jgi:hypothetical protein
MCDASVVLPRSLALHFGHSVRRPAMCPALQLRPISSAALIADGCKPTAPSRIAFEWAEMEAAQVLEDEARRRASANPWRYPRWHSHNCSIKVRSMFLKAWKRSAIAPANPQRARIALSRLSA